ncbi:MAG: acetate kinase [Bacilli bacterium]|nr:acetate kinase [Bacilli bacterium]
MKVLSVNAGSSSLKFKCYEMPEERVLASGVFERVGISGSFYRIVVNGEKREKKCDVSDHRDAFSKLMNELIRLNVINSFDEIETVGHRIVQGADHYKSSVIATDEVVKDVLDLASLAPLHNKAAAIGIKAAKEVIKNAVHVCVFDTAFHQTISKERYLYALPLDWYTEYHVRKYGAHGTSHKYITEHMKEKLGSNKRLIICHIGSGGSISAVKDGKCIDTSMGFTPNAGLIMGSRCGDIDVSIIPYIMSKKKYTKDDIAMLINKESGLLGLTGESDMRDVRKLADEGSELARTALNMYVDRIVDYIAKYYFELKGVDAIVLTAGVGENNAATRKEILEKLDFLGIKIDNSANEEILGYKDIHEGVITTEDSSIPVYVVPTDEEVMIGRDAYEFAK